MPQTFCADTSAKGESASNLLVARCQDAVSCAHTAQPRVRVVLLFSCARRTHTENTFREARPDYSGCPSRCTKFPNASGFLSVAISSVEGGVRVEKNHGLSPQKIRAFGLLSFVSDLSRCTDAEIKLDFLDAASRDRWEAPSWHQAVFAW